MIAILIHAASTSNNRSFCTLSTLRPLVSGNVCSAVLEQVGAAVQVSVSAQHQHN